MVAVEQQRQVGVRVHVDEPGREHQPAGVDHAVGGRVAAPESPIGGDPVAVDSTSAR